MNELLSALNSASIWLLSVLLAVFALAVTSKIGNDVMRLAVCTAKWLEDRRAPQKLSLVPEKET